MLQTVQVAELVSLSLVVETAVKVVFSQRRGILTIWVWTGYLWEDIISASTQLVLKYIDVLVDGPFIESRKNLMLPYCGSDNQRVIDVQKSLQEGAVRLWWDPEKSYDIFNMGRPFITKKED